MQEPIILFDGVCHLCNGSVQFIIKRDPEAYFRFTPLQSDRAQKILGDVPAPYPLPDSIILIEKGKVYTRSDAALRIARKLDGVWPIFFVFILIPSALRDKVYDFIASNRYKWFGKDENCMIPEPWMQERFLD